MVFLFGRNGLKTSIKPPVRGAGLCLECGAAAAEGAVWSQFVPRVCAQSWLTKTKGSPSLGGCERWGSCSRRGPGVSPT